MSVFSWRTAASAAGALVLSGSSIMAQHPGARETALVAKMDGAKEMSRSREPLVSTQHVGESLPQGARVTLYLRDAQLGAVLGEIARQGGVELLYGERQVPVEMRVSIAIVEAPVAEALRIALHPTGIEAHEVASGKFLLATGAERGASPGTAAVQLGSIVGRVTDARTGAGIEAAAVTIDGVRLGAIAGADGRYSIADIAPGTYQVTARRIGYVKATSQLVVAAEQRATLDFALEPSAGALEQVVVTGTVVPTERRALPTPISAISAAELQQQHVRSVDQIFRGLIPGSNAWDQPSVPYYSMINIRGANSLGANTVKTYIDGVEVADPMYIANIDPNIIDHIEVTRGPQASTIYGSDAAGGVMQIFTKRGQATLTRPELAASLAAGTISGTSVRGVAPKQEYTLSVLGGGGVASYAVGGSYRSTGEWTPSYSARDLGLHSSIDVAQGPIATHVFARYSTKTFNSAWDTRLRDLGYTAYSKPPYTQWTVRQQTFGVGIGYSAASWWRHELTLGYDRYAQDFLKTQPRYTTPRDSFLTVSTTDIGKASVKYNVAFTPSLGPSLSTALTAGVDHYQYDLADVYTLNATRTSGSLDGTHLATRTPSANTGLFTQLQLGFADKIFVTAGIRGERNASFGADFGTAWSPRVGLAYAHGSGPVIIKGRVSYGEASRAPSPMQKEAAYSPYQNQIAAPHLGPERQSGWDGGIDLQLGADASLGITYYDQLAKDLIDLVLIGAGTDAAPPTYQYQNSGRVRNTGWELEAKVAFREVRIAGTYALVSSTIKRLDPTYGGDYQVGDRLLGVPRMTAGATVTYTPFRRTTLVASASHASEWHEMDLLALYASIYGSEPYRGSNRAYWTTYPSFTKYNVSISQTVSQHVVGFVRVDNVANARPYENNNLMIPMGRVSTLGVQLKY